MRLNHSKSTVTSTAIYVEFTRLKGSLKSNTVQRHKWPQEKNAHDSTEVEEKEEKEEIENSVVCMLVFFSVLVSSVAYDDLFDTNL